MRILIAASFAACISLAPMGCNQGPEGGSAGTKDSFKLSGPSLSTTVKQGEKHNVKITIDRGSDFKKPITFTSDAHNGLTTSFDKKTVASGDPAETNMMIEAAKDAPLGDSVIKVTGTPEGGIATFVEVKVKVEAK
jgi:uncharacterized membrane protein